MVSERRNELIAEMLHRVHFIEKWGRGIRLILSKEPDTEFSEVGTKFVTTFKRRSYIEEVEKGAESWVKKLGEKLGEKAVERSVKKVGEKVGDKLTKNRQRIIDYMLQNKSISAKELAELVGISQRKMEKNISWLKEKGLIKRIGPDKGGYWEVIKK
jgi:ATP-dependent DNA helicase RecG